MTGIIAFAKCLNFPYSSLLSTKTLFISSLNISRKILKVSPCSSCIKEGAFTFDDSFFILDHKALRYFASRLKSFSFLPTPAVRTMSAILKIEDVFFNILRSLSRSVRSLTFLEIPIR